MQVAGGGREAGAYSSAPSSSRSHEANMRGAPRATGTVRNEKNLPSAVGHDLWVRCEQKCAERGAKAEWGEGVGGWGGRRRYEMLRPREGPRWRRGRRSRSRSQAGARGAVRVLRGGGPYPPACVFPAAQLSMHRPRLRPGFVWPAAAPRDTGVSAGPCPPAIHIHTHTTRERHAQRQPRAHRQAWLARVQPAAGRTGPEVEGGVVLRNTTRFAPHGGVPKPPSPHPFIAMDYTPCLHSPHAHAGDECGCHRRAARGTSHARFSCLHLTT